MRTTVTEHIIALVWVFATRAE